MKSRENIHHSIALPELKCKKKTIDKENMVSDQFSYKQLVLKSQRMSQIRARQGGSTKSHSRKFKSITKEQQTKVTLQHDTISIHPLKPLIGNHTPVHSLLSNLNHKLIQQPNIHLWSRLAREIQKENSNTQTQYKNSNNKNPYVWETLYRNMDTKINGQNCCFKIAKRKGNQTLYFIIIAKFNQKIHASFNEKQWGKICKIYRTYRQVQDCVSLSSDNKIVLPLNLESEAISQHLKRPGSSQDCFQF